MFSRKIYILSVLCLSACSSGPTSSGANHLGNPLTWPAAALNTGLNNAFYNARRNRVADYVAQNQNRIMTNVSTQGGPFLTKAMSLAHVRPAQQPAVLAALQADPALYATDAEALVVALMVHGDPRPAPQG
ncbi:hypothetical protein [Algirhabdus cladophorae]|uniref:hypothetical protein n=1 Tax=Algirhabdus cladophorae TaxID=3377108 RepID=UPI003B848350